MKNIHVLATDKPSRLIINWEKDLCYKSKPYLMEGTQNIYITSEEEIKEGDWCVDDIGDVFKIEYLKYFKEFCKKIILTTDQDLIKDGVQAIDDEFLEWFVAKANDSGKPIDIVEVIYGLYNPMGRKVSSEKVSENHSQCVWKYKIIIPKEEPKQLFTDHPITELGDEEYKEAPIRECELLSYDDNKYCYVKVEGIEKEIKRCYIYSQRGRCGEVDCISVDEIKELLKEKPKKKHIVMLVGDKVKEEPKTFKELFANTGIEPTTDENGNIQYNFKATIKQETLEEAAERLAYDSTEENKGFPQMKAFINGAKWKQERSYSEEDMKEAIRFGFDKGFCSNSSNKEKNTSLSEQEWFEQFKKK